MSQESDFWNRTSCRFEEQNGQKKYLMSQNIKDRFESVIDSRYLEITAQINNFNQKLEILENQPKQSLYNNDSDEFSSDLNHHISNSPHDNKTEQAPVVSKALCKS
ncbi:putative conjugative transfer protein TraB [Orientia tsutsugamushi str. UT76]|nr:putative conjugative transfer protein TraB [Orientia tsutsugamushi str. UT76]